MTFRSAAPVTILISSIPDRHEERRPNRRTGQSRHRYCPREVQRITFFQTMSRTARPCSASTPSSTATPWTRCPPAIGRRRARRRGRQRHAERRRGAVRWVGPAMETRIERAQKQKRAKRKQGHHASEAPRSRHHATAKLANNLWAPWAMRKGILFLALKT